MENQDVHLSEPEATAESRAEYRALLDHSFTTMCALDNKMSRLEYLSDYIFDFTTYDSAMGELFAAKALEVCAAINDRKTFDYIKDADNYRWYLVMVNMPFFAGRLDWGTSVRGAWWSHDDQKLDTCGLWRGDEQITDLEFSREAWQCFTAALADFAKPMKDSPAPTQSTPE
jgi:hypothetical protein